MEPIAVTVRAESRWVLIHRCTHCGRLRLNKTAGDDNVLLLMQLAALPLATPFVPFAVEPAPLTGARDGRGKSSASARNPDRAARPSGGEDEPAVASAG